VRRWMSLLVLQVNLCFFPDGASSIYDGTPLVGQSVARVRRSSFSVLFSTFSNGLYSREPQSFLCLSTTVLDLLVSLKGPRLWKKVRSTSACTTNGSPFSGCRRISLCLVAILARYVRATVPVIVCITIYCRSPYLERAREQCLHPIITSTTIFQLLPELLCALFSRTTRCLIS